MEPHEYPFHAGARSSLRIVGILLCVTVVLSPVGIWILYRVSTAKLTLSPTSVAARALASTVQVTFAEVARVGVLRVAVPGAGVAGSLAQRKVGGTHAIHLCFLDRAGKTKRFMISMYEQHEKVMQEICGMLHMQPVVMAMGAIGPKWPKAA